MEMQTIGVSSYLSNIVELSDQTNTSISKADSVIDGIKAISSQSNLLAINTDEV